VLVRQPSSTGAFLLSGNQARTGTFIGSAGAAYVVSGYPSTFTRNFEAWFPRPFDVDGWSDAASEAEPWTSVQDSKSVWAVETGPTSNWTPSVIQSEPWTIE
jgi:hypothetical protein